MCRQTRCSKLSETRIACVDATESLSDVYTIVHERKTHIAHRNSDNELNAK